MFKRRIDLRGLVRFRRGEFVSNVRRLLGATATGQLIGVALVPIVSRIFAPSEFGLATSVLAVANTLSTFSSLRYQQAIIIAEDQGEAETVLRLAVLIALLLTAVELLAVLISQGLFADSISEWLQGQAGLLYAAPIVGLLTGLTLVLKAWQIRSKGFRRIGGAAIVVGASVPLTRISLGLSAGATAGALIAGTGLGLVAQIAVLGTAKLRAACRGTLAEIRSGRLWSTARQYRDFPLFSAPEALLHNVSNTLPIYVLGFIYEPAVVGFYVMATRLVRLPVDALSQSVRQVYFQKSTELKSRGRDEISAFFKITGVLFVAGLIPFTVLGLYAEDLFRLFLGDRWGTAGAYTSVLVMWIFAGFVAVPSQVVFVTYRQQARWLRFQIALLLLRVGVFVVGYLLGIEALPLIALFAVTGGLFNVFIMFIAYGIIIQGRDHDVSRSA